ncbi:hypothetical protein PGTUg99_016322 [Puccinia graminis f. sp. tritici]|uniref:Uncharacterized protein n=1 Tax=Puccinia graminis f. sp. tritici TaxID=56615 RepID=A0A5B0RP97_PUCGR|nr:hypothetical protein PGTUg99_016322 [Puccinia graminis f. sp. tritici]
MQILKISLLLLPIVVGNIMPDFELILVHTVDCQKANVDVRNLDEGICPSDNCGAKFYQRVVAYCHNCKDEEEVNPTACFQHGGRVKFINDKTRRNQSQRQFRVSTT